ncbi:MAG: heavy metal-responsive transcriptional regulator [Myxococcaceae bacterium]|nr:MAG: heavy metal-responsive transcriptional regulator [Myxococcaceae bacterium]
MSSPHEPLTIGTLARLGGIGVETVRFYERQGLLVQPRRPARGYRLYSPEALDQIRFIRRSKALGFTLDEIRDLLALRAQPGVPCRVVRVQAQAKVADIDRKMAELARLREAVASLAQACTGDMPMQQCSILSALEGEPPLAPPEQQSRGAQPGKRASASRGQRTRRA